MDSTLGAVLDEDRYRTEVLQLESSEAEQARAQQLCDEARQLGLKVPEIEASAPLAASIASGIVDLSSPVLSSGSSTDRNSIRDGSITPSHETSSYSPVALNQIVSSLSDITLASARVKPGSTRSHASLSTRPTSFCSSESRTLPGGYGSHHDGLAVNQNRMSMISLASVDKKEKRRSSIKNAIGRIHFRKKRPSSVIFPPNAQINISEGETGVDRRDLESKPEPQASHDIVPRPATAVEPLPRLEIPAFDKESMQRSADDPELSAMHERHRMERDRHVAFQVAAISTLRRRHQTAIHERLVENKRLEEEKEQKNTAAALRIEERQLAVEVEQQREFDRAKMNSRTRIKHMEGYFRNASPPPSPAGAAQRSSDSFSGSDTTPPSRRFTRQQREQLEQQYHAHESMDALHEARIKVLRDRQELKLQEAIERMERELENLIQQHLKDVQALQAEHQKEESYLLRAIDSKKTNLRHRWYLEEAILRRQLETRNSQRYGPLPQIPFSGSSTEISGSTISTAEPSPVTAGDTKESTAMPSPAEHPCA
ncbi:hypothetical protein N7523_008065 [Penicillium sp. IBT 18751x]|nr:hypothetical protein N7523_008065 [Penicillium sp. IBT 18751x]